MSIDDFMDLMTDYGDEMSRAGAAFIHTGATAARDHWKNADAIKERIRVNLEGLYDAFGGVADTTESHGGES